MDKGRRVLGAWCWVLGAGALCLVLGARAPLRAQGLTLTVIEVLDQYDRHRDLAVGALSKIEHVGSIEDALKADGEQWINADGPKNAPRRRLVAATFALEAARIGLDREWIIGARLVEWGCAALRKQQTPLPDERLWQRAALALIEGAQDFEFIEYARERKGERPGRGPDRHLEHALSRFPDDPRMQMARAWLSTQPVIQPPFFYPWDPSGNIVAGETVRAYETALKIPELAAEAHVHLGYFYLFDNQFAKADAHLADAERLATEPDIKYLAGLFSGWSNMRQKKRAEMITGYRRAVTAVPNAQTAAVSLAAALYADGDRQQASAIIELALNDPAIDPWLNFGYGDFRLFSVIMRQLREKLGEPDAR